MNIRPSGMPRTLNRLCMLLIAAMLPLMLSAKTEADNSAKLSFVENKGQITDQYQKARRDIDFKLATPDMGIFIGDGQIHYQWARPADDKSPKKAFMKGLKDKPEGVLYNLYRMDVVLEGANTNAAVVKENMQPYSETWYTPATEQGATVHTYQKITYRNVYPNIDWVLYTGADGFKYDFVVHPGGDPKRIRLRYSGHTALAMDKGGLVATTPEGSITEHKPYAYNSLTKEEVPSAFVLNGSTVSFNVTAPTSGDLVIDPAINWATYYGGSGSEEIYGSAATATGDLYIAGATYSQLNIVTTGAHQTTYTYYFDAFLVKFNSSGVRQWGTYYGGSGDDIFRGICLDKFGNVIATGITWSSSGIATAGSHKSSITTNNTEAMLVKFNSAGVRQWGTYYGGTISNSWSSTENSHGFSVACDTTGNIYLAGVTTATTNIATSGAFWTSIGFGDQPAFLAKFNNSGIRQWGTYFGYYDSYNPLYSVYTSVPDIAVSRQGNLYLVGTTYGNSNISTSGTFQPNVAGDLDCYLVKFNSSGQRQWGTFFGGIDDEYNGGVACDSNENIYICGTTYTENGLATTNAFKTAAAFNTWTPGPDVFIASFNSSGARNWSTYYGGPGSEVGTDIAFTAPNGVYVTGVTFSTVVPNEMRIAYGVSPQTTLNGNSDAFAAKFTSNGQQIAWGTYFGGDDEDYAFTLAQGGSQMYIAGETSSGAFLSTSNAHQASRGSTYDGFITALSDCIANTYPNPITGSDTVCKGIQFTFKTDSVPTATAYDWFIFGDWIDGYASRDSLYITFDDNPEAVEVLMIARNDCGNTTHSKITITVNTVDHNNISVLGDTTFCEFDSVLLKPDPGPYTYTWLRNDTAIATTTSGFAAKTSGDYHFIAADAAGCADTSRKVPVVVFPAPQPVVTLSNMFDLSTGVFTKYQWFKDGTAIPNATGITYTATANGSYTVFVEDGKGCGNMSAPITISNVSVADIAAGKLAIYPNPVVDVVTIKGISEGNYSIVNVLGEQVRSGILTSEQLDLSSLTSGNYVLNIVTPQGNTATTKFVKQ